MSAQHRDRLAGLVLLSIAVLWCVAVRLTIPPGYVSEIIGPAAMPFWLGVALAGFALTLVVTSYASDSESSRDAPNPFGAKNFGRSHELWAIGLVAVTVAAYALLMNWFGFVAATIVAVGGLLRFGLRVRSVPVLFGLSFGLAVGVYVVMDLLMGVILPHGTILSIN